jgi:hypothetical protein
MAPPSHYGSYIFQVACGELIITNYNTRAATYETTQRFMIVIGCLIILVSAIGLVAALTKLRRRLQQRSAALDGDDCLPRS